MAKGVSSIEVAALLGVSRVKLWPTPRFERMNDGDVPEILEMTELR